MTKTILCTGIAGFIGHHLCEAVLKTTDWNIIGIDRLTYASSGFDRLKDIGAYDNPRVKIFTHNFVYPIEGSLIKEIGNINYIAHLGAETHVDRSIKDPLSFVQSNVIGTLQMLEFAKIVKPEKFLYFSTDEIFGPAIEGMSYKEWDRYNCTNPYSASKAGGEELCLAYANTYKIPMIITHTMNCYGERQHREKYIPIVMNSLIDDKVLQVHCSNGQPASRSWIHARNASDGVLFLLQHSPSGRDKWNITGEKEYNNLDLALLIAQFMGKPLKYELVDHYADRPGHDFRYMIDGSKIREQGWEMPIDFEHSLKKTIEWSLAHDRWLRWE